MDRSLLKEFAKVVNDVGEKPEPKQYVYGTITSGDGDSKCVVLDGSDMVTPISEVVNAEAGDRVLVAVSNHQATVIGNITFPPSARKEDQAISDASTAVNQSNAAIEKAQDAQTKADKASEDSSIASSLADEAKKESAKAQEAADQAKTDATEAKNQAKASNDKSDETQQLVNQVKDSVTAANKDISSLKSEVKSNQDEIQNALTDLGNQADEIESIKQTYSTKVETDKIKADLSTEITTKVGDLSTTVSENYATKDSVVQMEGNLTTKIEQNATDISSTVTKVEKLQSDTTEQQKNIDKALEDANNAQTTANEATTKANAAQEAADQAKANADAASTNAANAQKTADLANEKVAAADKNLAAAKTDLAEAQKNLETVTSRVDATEKEIADAQTKVDTANANVNKALEDVASANAAASNANTVANKAQADATAANTAASNAQTKADNAQKAADSAKAQADKAQSDLASLTSRVTKAETSIKQNSDQISLNATKTTEVSNKINNLKIGGRNLILNSDTWTGISTSSATGITRSIEDGVLKIVSTSGNGNWNSFNRKNVIEANLNEGDPFTFAIEIKSEDGTVPPSIYFKQGFGYVNLKGTVSSDYSWCYYTGTWKKKNPIALHFGWANAIGTYYIRKIKFDKGNTPTDWSPAPEDTDNAINSINSNIQNNYYNKTQTDAQIKASADSINLTVSEVSKTVTSANTNASNALSKATSAESNASSALTKANDLTTRANNGEFKGEKGDGYWVTDVWVDLSSLDVNTWYPVTGTAISARESNGNYRIAVNVALNANKPSWSTHSAGFTVNLEIQAQPSDWGTTDAKTLIYSDTFKYCSVSPASYSQMTYGSIPVLYLRGGGKYRVLTTYKCTWTIRENGYTWTSGNYSQTVSPTSSRPTPMGTNIQGKNGADGKGIKSTVITYQAWANGTSTPTGTWSSTPPATSASAPYLWTKTVITYTDGTTSTSYSVGSTPDGILVGGRNLLKGSHSTAQEYTYPTSNYADKWGLMTTMPLNGDTYTMSFWAKSTVDKDVIRVHFHSPSNIKTVKGSQGQTNTAGDGQCDFTLSTTLTKYWVTYTIPKNVNSRYSIILPRLLTGKGTGTVAVIYEMFEEGNKAGDWTPAPEDMDQNIYDSINTAIDASEKSTEQKYVSLINETSKKLELLVQQLETTTTSNSTSITDISNKLQITSEMAQFVKTTTDKLEDMVNGKMSSSEVQQWARFDGANLELGASDQPFKCKLSTTELAFYQNENKVAWISNNELHVLRAIIAESIGCGNFKFVDEGDLGFSLI